METLTMVLKALADRNRLRIIKLLEKKNMCVCELAFVLGITQPSVSRHLKKLETAGLIEGEQESFWTNYSLKKGNTYTGGLLNNLGGWLNDDAVTISDLKKAAQADRRKLCNK